MKRSKQGRALFYTRDSGGKHETTPGQYVAWAIGEAVRLGLSFSGTPEAMEAMIRDGRPQLGDLFLDYDVCGNLFSRPGLDRLFAEADADKTVSHVLIPRRDRLSRPDDALEGVALENKLRRSGIALVYMGRIYQPIAKGQRVSIEEMLGGVIDYDRAGKDRTDLAQKIIYAQLSLAKAGYSTGGRPPYGFRRWLVKDDGTQIRQLEEAERIRMRGHHVVWLPGPESELAVIRRILDMLPGMPATRVARQLTVEGVPSPDNGRTRTDNGIKHLTSGVWNQTTIVNIARNPLLQAISSHGRRSMGDQLRYTAHGPRALEDTDFRSDGKPKVIRNPDEAINRAPAHFDALVDLDKHQELMQILDRRGTSQRGKPRSRNPDNNPLGSRVFDMNCGWPMYRAPYSKTFRYVCGAYTQSQQCDHNHVDGPIATRFVLSALRQKLVMPRVLDKLKERLKVLAARDRIGSSPLTEMSAQKAALDKVRADLAKVQRNMALADSPEQYRAMADVFEDLRKQQADLEQQLAKTNGRQGIQYDAEVEIAAALAALTRLPDLAADGQNLAKVGEAFRLTNVRLFLKFEKVRVKNRMLNKLAHGMVTFGEAPAPVSLYAGPTGRRALAANTVATVAASPEGDVPLPDQFGLGREGNSLGNVNRGDRI